MKQIPWDREGVMKCTTGVFSLTAGYRLANAGHTRVRVVFGGYSAWRAHDPLGAIFHFHPVRLRQRADLARDHSPPAPQADVYP